MKLKLNHIGMYWKLTKSLQTGLLLATGLTGYMSGSCPVFNWTTGRVSQAKGLQLGCLLSLLGLSWAFVLNPLYGGSVLRVVLRRRGIQHLVEAANCMEHRLGRYLGMRI